MRTAADDRELILAELRRGRLRQGWGWDPAQDLRLLRAKKQTGEPLADWERAAWRNRRLLEDSWDGLQVGDIVLLPNLPHYGVWSLARITGPYAYDIVEGRNDFGHLRPVDLITDATGKPAVIHPSHALVPARLRRSMRSRQRMWSLDEFAAELEALITAARAGERTDAPQPADELFQKLAGDMRARAYELIDHKFGGAELEDLVVRVLRARYRALHGDVTVEHYGGAGEHGIDVLAKIPDPLGVVLRVGIQVKKHDGVETSLASLEQIKEAHGHWGIHAGVVITTAVETTDEYEARREALEGELGISIRVITRDEFMDIVLAHIVDASRPDEGDGADAGIGPLTT